MKLANAKIILRLEKTNKKVFLIKKNVQIAMGLNCSSLTVYSKLIKGHRIVSFLKINCAQCPVSRRGGDSRNAIESKTKYQPVHWAE